MTSRRPEPRRRDGGAAHAGTGGAPSAPAPGPRRRAVFTALTALVPVFFFLAVEGSLRLAGYGSDYPLFVPVPGADEWLTQNRDVARRYFSDQNAVPTSLGDSFRARKDSTTFRIFVQGGSSAAGYPYYYGGAFSRMLQQRLQQTYPERRIEVINTAMAAVASYTLLDFEGEILARSPDAVLVYAGHNEYYGAFGVGSSESIGRVRGLVNLYLRLRSWRTVQALRGLLAAAASLAAGDRPTGPPARTLMERMVGEQRIPIGSSLFRLGIEQFEGNLAGLLGTYREAGVPVYVSTLASNERDHAPFESAPAAGVDPVAWRTSVQMAESIAAAGDTALALARLDSLARRDSIDADVRFAAARLLYGLGRFDAARAAYLSAKDRDQLRFRAPEAMNTVIRRVADRYGARVVDGQAALRRAAPGGIIDGSLMLEHLHPNVDGYFLIADAFYEALLADTLIGASPRRVAADRARADILVTALDSTFGALRVRQLLASWPFRPAGVFDRSLDTLTARTTAEALALDLHRGRTSWYEAANRLREAYAQVGDHHRALRVALAMIQQYPFLPAPYAFAGEAMLRQRRGAEALEYYRSAVELEDSAPVRVVMGDILSALADDRRAAEEYERAATLRPEDPEIALKLGRAYALSGRLDASRQALERLLARVPDEPRVAAALASLRRVENL